MNIKRLAIGTITGIIALQLLGWLIFGIAFAEFFTGQAGAATGVDREHFVVWSLVVGDACYALLIVLGLDLRRGQLGIVDGLKTGAVVGLLLWGAADFTMFGITHVNTLTGTIADTLLELVRGGVAGAVIAAVLSRVGGRTPVTAAAA